MTQAVVNNVNNIQDMMLQAQQKVKSASAEISSLDKNLKADFEKIYNKQVDKAENNTQSPKQELKQNQDVENNSIDLNKASKVVSKTEIVETASPKTLGDIKNNYQEPLITTTTNQKTLGEVIAEAAGDANVETSLDLSLNRDINEIISQFKEVVDNTIVETDQDESKSISNVVKEIDNTEVVEEIEAIEDVKDVEDLEAIIQDSKQILGQNDAISKEALTLYQQIAKAVDMELPTNNLLKASDAITLDEVTVTTETEVAITDDTKQASQKLEDIVDEEILEDLNIESVDVETTSSNSDGSSLMEHQSPQEQAVKAMFQQDAEVFELKIEKPLNVQNTQNVQAKTVDVNPSKIIEQITKQLEGLQNTSRVNIVLNPEALGKVTIQLIKTGEGLSAQFTVASQEVRDLLMKGLDGLKETLVSHGVGVDNVSVKLQEAQKSEYSADWTEQEGSRGGNKEQGQSKQNEKDKEVFEQMMAQFNKENGKV